MPPDFLLTKWMIDYAVAEGIAPDRVRSVFEKWKAGMINGGYTSANWEKGGWPSGVQKRLQWDKDDLAKQNRDQERERRSQAGYRSPTSSGVL